MSEVEEDYLSLKEENSLESNLSNFQTNLQKISKEVSLDNSDFQNDKIAFSAQRVILSNLLVLLPVVVQKVIDKPGQGAVYALTNVITQINDLFNQLRNSENLENQVDFICESIVYPTFKEIITQVFDKSYYLKQEIKQDALFLGNTELTNKTFSYMDCLLKHIGTIINEKQDTVKDKLKSYLVEFE